MKELIQDGFGWDQKHIVRISINLLHWLMNESIY
jgi:hypothetical protein